MEAFIKIDNTYYRENALEQIEDNGKTIVLKVRVDGKLKEFTIDSSKKETFLSSIERVHFLTGAKFKSVLP